MLFRVKGRRHLMKWFQLLKPFEVCPGVIFWSNLFLIVLICDFKAHIQSAQFAGFARPVSALSMKRNRTNTSFEGLPTVFGSRIRVLGASFPSLRLKISKQVATEIHPLLPIINWWTDQIHILTLNSLPAKQASWGSFREVMQGALISFYLIWSLYISILHSNCHCFLPSTSTHTCWSRTD